MPDASTLLTFLIALAVLELTPGPDMMLVVARGVGQGRRIALLTVVGMVLVAGIVQVGFLVLGLASLFQAYPSALIILRWAGAAYLVYLGARMIRQSFGRPSCPKPNTMPASGLTAVREGALNNLTNPKSLLFMFTFLPLFVDPGAGPVWLQLLVLGSLQKLTGVLSLGGVALASGSVGHFLRRWPSLFSWQERFTGVVLIGLGVRLFVSGGPASTAVR